MARRSTWEDAAAIRKDVAAEYWRRKSVRVIDGPPEDQAYQIDKLIEANRTFEAFDGTALHIDQIPTSTLVRLFDATFEQLAQAKTANEIQGLRSRSVSEFLDEMRKRPELSREDLARREYRALPLLGHRIERGLTIHDFTAEDPDFFVEVLSAVFLPAHRDKSKDVTPTPDDQATAQAAYRLLDNMRQIPGQLEHEVIDESVLLTWIDRVRAKATEVDRATVADLAIGEILAHTGEDPEDGSWPHEAVRNVVEIVASDDLDQGIHTERRNMRGAYRKTLFEGGAQERELAEQYRGWAVTVRARWPRMAGIPETIANAYDEQGASEDLRAEQRKYSS